MISTIVKYPDNGIWGKYGRFTAWTGRQQRAVAVTTVGTSTYAAVGSSAKRGDEAESVRKLFIEPAFRRLLRGIRPGGPDESGCYKPMGVAFVTVHDV